MFKKDDSTIIVMDYNNPQGYRIVQQAPNGSKKIRIMTSEEYAKYQAEKIGDEISLVIVFYIVLYPIMIAFDKAFDEKHPVWRKWVMFFICLIFGGFGIHRFILKKPKSGIIQLLTFGGLLIWWIIDIFRILSGCFPDSDGIDFKDKIKRYKKIKKEIF